MDFFVTVEFYIIAITIAVLIAGFFLKSHREAQSYSYIYQGDISFSESSHLDEEESVDVVSQDNGTTLIIHRNVVLPIDATVNIKIDVCGETLSCVEKMVESMPEEQVFCYDVKFTVKCLKYLSYKMRYECMYNGKWCNLSFTNNGNTSVKKILKQ